MEHLTTTARLTGDSMTTAWRLESGRPVEQVGPRQVVQDGITLTVAAEGVRPIIRDLDLAAAIELFRALEAHLDNIRPTWETNPDGSAPVLDLEAVKGWTAQACNAAEAYMNTDRNGVVWDQKSGLRYTYNAVLAVTSKAGQYRDSRDAEAPVVADDPEEVPAADRPIPYSEVADWTPLECAAAQSWMKDRQGVGAVDTRSGRVYSPAAATTVHSRAAEYRNQEAGR